jgi:hypothetical protein
MGLGSQPGGLCSIDPDLPRPEWGSPGVLMPALFLVTGSAGEAFLSTIQRAAEVVANVVRPGPENPNTQRLLPRGDTYQPAVTPSSSHSRPTPGNLIPGPQGMEGRAPSLGSVSFLPINLGLGSFVGVEANNSAARMARAPVPQLRTQPLSPGPGPPGRGA